MKTPKSISLFFLSDNRCFTPVSYIEHYAIELGAARFFMQSLMNIRAVSYK